MSTLRPMLETQRSEIAAYVFGLEQQLDLLRLRRDRLRHLWQGDAGAQFQQLATHMITRFEGEVRALHLLLKHFDDALRRSDGTLGPQAS